MSHTSTTSSKQVNHIRLGRDLADEHRELAVRKGLHIVHRRSVDEQLGEQRVEWLRVLPEDPGKVINELLSERLQLHFPRPTRSLVHMLEQLDAQYGVEELKPRICSPSSWYSRINRAGPGTELGLDINRDPRLQPCLLPRTTAVILTYVDLYL